MGIGTEHYAFALFIAALVCLIAIICRLLFANVRRLRKTLEEKEANLMQLYRTVERVMEDFNDQIRTAMDDIKGYESLAAERLASLARPPEPIVNEEPERPVQLENPKRAMTVDSSRIRAASEVLERAERMVKSKTGKSVDYVVGNDNGEVIQRLFDDITVEQQAVVTETQIKQKRKESILALADDGKTHAQIARELGITQNEVKLVIDLNNTFRTS